MSKVKVKTKLKEQQTTVVQEDLATTMRQKARILAEAINKGYIGLAHALFEIKYKEYYRDWGIATFRIYVEKELDLNFQKADRLTKIWDAIKSLNLPIEELEVIGFTKATIMVQHVTEDNKNELIALAKNLSVIEFTKAAADSTYSQKTSPATTRAYVIKLGGGSAGVQVIQDGVELAKRIFETDDDGVALSSIINEWVTDKAGVLEKVTLETHLELLKRNYGVAAFTYTMLADNNYADKYDDLEFEDSEEDDEDDLEEELA